MYFLRGTQCECIGGVTWTNRKNISFFYVDNPSVEMVGIVWRVVGFDANYTIPWTSDHCPSFYDSFDLLIKSSNSSVSDTQGNSLSGQRSSSSTATGPVQNSEPIEKPHLSTNLSGPLRFTANFPTRQILQARNAKFVDKPSCCTEFWKK